MLRQAAIALSLANLCYLRIWHQILSTDAATLYNAEGPTSPSVYLAVMGCVVLNAAIMLAGVRVWARLFRGKLAFVANGIFLCAIAIVLKDALAIAANHFPWLNGAPIRAVLWLPGVAGGFLVFLPLVYFFRRRIVPVFAALVLILTPFVAVTFGNAVARMVSGEAPGFHARPAAGNVGKPARRLVWIIFDELDQHRSFERRPAGLKLPEFDRIAQNSLVAINAYPPNDSTIVVMPSLISGRRFESAKAISADSLELRVSESSEPLVWRSSESIFAKARSLGLNTGLVGWYHPYCRVLNTELTACWTHDFSSLRGAISSSPLPFRLNRSIFETTLYSPFGQSLVSQHHAENLLRAIEKAVEYASDPDLGFSLIHLGLPHRPHVYSRARKDFSLGNSPVVGYVDSLVLADVVIGRIRASMESSQTWDDSTILISSDHFLRVLSEPMGRQEFRVPFMLKLPNQKTGAVYEPVLCTLAGHDLLLELARGSIGSVGEVISWLDTHRRESDIPASYLKGPVARRAM